MSAGGESPAEVVRFGLIVVGDEVLSGSRSDAHLGAVKARLAALGHELGWYWVLPDTRDVLVSHLRFSMSLAVPVIVCGGIGATPDDRTREAAARAADVPVTRHPEAVALIEAKFGAEAYPHRILMAELPAGASLIPNPVNQIPGFALRDHWFLPGFPKLAWPMLDWVLSEHFSAAAPLREAALRVEGCPESRLIPCMRAIEAAFPALKVFSLPHMGEDPHILLGVRGRSDLAPALAQMCAALNREAIRYRQVGAA